jgi:diguanylate cyclase (GGDEF)-like protein/PAS domain S-box-containing protein
VTEETTIREEAEPLKSAEPPPRKHSMARHAVLSIFFVATYLLLSQPGIIFVSRLGWSAWYPATGLSVAILLGVSPWYAVVVAFSDALAGALFYHQPLWSFGETIGVVLGAFWYGGAAYLLRVPLRVDLSLRCGRDVVCYVFVTMVAALGATVTGVLCLLGDHSIVLSEWWTASSAWFIGDGIALMGLAPFLLIHVFPSVRRWLGFADSRRDAFLDRRKPARSHDWHVVEAIGQAAGIIAVLWIMFGPRWGQLELFYLAFIPILWLAMRSGIRAVAVGTLALNFGIVISLHLFQPGSTQLAKVGLLMLVVSTSGLVVGATVTERQRLGAQLRERTTYLNSLFENSPLGIVVLNPVGRVDLVNDAFTRLSLYQSSELVGRDLDSIFLPAESAEVQAQWAADVLEGRPKHWTARRRRKDGSVVDLELQAVPLVIDGSVRGAYALCKDISEQVRSFAAEREHAKSLNALVKELEQQTDQMSLLNDMARLLECCASTKEACQVVAQSIPRFFPEATAGTLYTFKASRNLVESAVSWGNPPQAEPVFSPQDCWALRRGQPHVSGGGKQDIICPHLEGLPSARHLCLPMVGQGETLGVICIEFSRQGESDGSLHTQSRLGVTVASQIALSLASLRLRESLRDQSIRDSLTGLFNRRFMQESLEREIMRSRRKNHPLSLLFLDIDHFKRFNDTFGHDAGDFVLRAVADVLRNYFRGEDVACRCGGEEFAVILPESLARNAEIRAEGLRQELRGLKLQYKDTRLGPISVSIGVAAFPEHCSTAEDLLKIADQCLYQSKTKGRDRVTVASATTMTLAGAKVDVSVPDHI